MRHERRTRAAPRSQLMRWAVARASPQDLHRWGITLLVLAATAIAVLAVRLGPCTAHLPDNRRSPSSGSYPTSASEAAAAAADPSREGAFATSADNEWLHLDRGPPRTLHFDVCNGFANQRLALVYGLVAAKRLGRAAVLPNLILDGTQSTDAPILATDPGAAVARFESVYDAEALAAALLKHGLRVMTEDEFRDANGDDIAPTQIALSGSGAVDNMEGMLQLVPHARHVSIDCPLFRFSPDVLRSEEALVWATLRALRPGPKLAKLAKAYDKQVGRKPFNFLHLRIEKDWLAHCKRCGGVGFGGFWVGQGCVISRGGEVRNRRVFPQPTTPQDPPHLLPLIQKNRWSTYGNVWDGVVRDNCYNNTLAIDAVLADRRFDPALPLYVAAHWPDVPAATADALLAKLAKAGYKVLRAPAPAAGHERKREIGALLEYTLALRAEKFIGNSVSTFSALAILERRADGRWAGYYNDGSIPLATFVPLFSTPWVFTFNSWSGGYEYMLKVAVNSAAAVGHVTPHCVFAGDMKAPIVKWMEGRGVRVLHHDPAWRDALAPLANASNVDLSPLFSSAETVVATWQRIDVPLIPWLDQYTYILFTDTDVVFRRPFSLTELPLPLPKSVGLGPEMVSSFPYNAGVMVAHLPALRASYPQFLKFILNNTQGLMFPNYGPGDQVRGGCGFVYWGCPARLLPSPACNRRTPSCAVPAASSASTHFNPPTNKQPLPPRAPTTSFTSRTSAPGASPSSSTPSPTTSARPATTTTWQSSTSTAPSRCSTSTTPPLARAGR